MRRPRNPLRPCALLVLIASVGLAAEDFTLAAFTSQAGTPANRVSAASDFRAPTVGASVIAKAAGGTPGFVKQGGGYHVYANVSDAGNPASGVGSVTADLSAITTGATAASLVSGSFSVGGTSYGYRSAQLTANASLSEGLKSYTVSATDNASNASGPTGGFSVTVDNTAPSGSDVQTANGGSTAGTAEQGDTITYSFSEQIDPASVLSGWTGSSTSVVVRLINGGALPTAPDTFQVWNVANNAQLPLGTTTLPSGTYVGGLAGAEVASFGAGGTASTMVMSGSTITIALGTAGGQAATAGVLAGAMSWVPSATATDRAGNVTSTATVTESTPPNDTEF